MREYVKIPGGQYSIGTDAMDGFPKDKEGPKITIELPSYFIQTTTVTNENFQEFIRETGFITEAEKFGWSYVFHYFLSEEDKIKAPKVPGLNWWFAVEGADWQHPEGPNSTIIDRMDHPVVHVSRNDCLAYCKWEGSRLPTEAEWEVAAKGGTESERYPWGPELLKDNDWQCNIWQGNFPLDNTLEDGFSHTAPVKTYEPNGYGLYQVIGNIWEWCLNPQGIELAEFHSKKSSDFFSLHSTYDSGAFAIRGGSFLCHESYCKRYRIAARNGNTGDSSSNNMGFRTVKDY